MGDNYRIIPSLKSTVKLALMPLAGEGQGEGESEGPFGLCFVHPHLHPPPSKGEESFQEI